MKFKTIDKKEEIFMKFDRNFDVEDIKAVRTVKNFANKHDIKGVVKKYSKKVQSVAVIASLGVVCTASITAAKQSDVPSDGRVISISDVKAEADVFGTGFDRVSYEEMKGLRYESDQYAKIEVSEKNYEAVLLAKDADEKNKEALRKLNEENEERIRKEAEAKRAEEERIAEEARRAEESRKAEEAAKSEDVKAEETVVEETQDDEDVLYIESDSESGTYLGEFVTTAYCPCAYCCGKSDGITASGTHATAGRTIAADPSRFSYGTQLVIDGHTYVVEDCGGSINGNRIDIFFDTHQEALNYGTRTVSVYSK